MKKDLPYTRKWFSRNTAEVARDLLGSVLIRNIDGRKMTGLIAETEAYLGEDDPAAHVFKGRTPRTEVLYQEPGRAYVYQMHRQHLLNVSTDERGIPGCVLIRGIIPMQGIETMRKHRDNGYVLSLQSLADGPGKLCQSLSITLDQYGIDMTSGNSGLYIAEGPKLEFGTGTSGRVGVSSAEDWDMRFFINDSDIWEKVNAVA